MVMISIRTMATLLLCLVFSGCTNADGIAVVTGQKRPVISPEQVQLYSEAPQEPYETIALVNARSASGWTDQESIDYAIAELKNQAAAVGANGVLLGQLSTQTGGFVMIDGVAYPYDEQTVAGKAIYVSGD